MAASTPTSASVRRALRDVFGLKTFRAQQQHVIERLLRGSSTLAVMPTGAGKSLCYQLPAVLLDGLCVVVSPLIALMKDQCDRLNALGVTAVALHSGLDARALEEAKAAFAAGARIVFVTPERLADAQTIEELRARGVALLVVDEAHCISQWGHDFRPAYLEIGPAVQQLGRPTVLALTATATEAISADIAEQLGIAADGVIRTGSYRANLHYRVEVMASEAQKLERLRSLIDAQRGAGIVYAATVKSAIAVHEALRAHGVDAGLYHGRLPARQRTEVQDAFMQQGLRVVVATNAFGLGIDRADLRFVIHYQMPSGLDAYYQESGRAGRDGESALCTLLFLRQDKAVQRFFLAGRYPAEDEIEAVYRAIGEPACEGAAWTLDALEARLQRPRSKLQVAVSLLRRQGIVRQDRTGRLRVLRTGLKADALKALGASYADKRSEDDALLEQMAFYAQSGWCRWRVLLEHFESVPPGFDRCGHCDNCLRLAQHLERAACEQPAAPSDDAAHAQANEKPQLRPGDEVRVRRYGRGRVLSVNGDAVDVSFPTGQSRCFLADWLQPLGLKARRAAAR